MKKLFSLALMILGFYLVLSNSGGDIVPIVFGIILGIIGASWYGVITKREKAELDAKVWPKDEEYR
ncbi:hypothetical protein [Vibrio agarivorans]|uniref:Uncharacterized protein n=1 Tax=Vibrio agarivorans TaxID=153622 RepID=A0ABT7Y7H2_9VIBR|nr:hypothetical protein [Vibrio agarivorans]MDN2484002.1 hypothetical protein [Vibrio agarivorans]